MIRSLRAVVAALVAPLVGVGLAWAGAAPASASPWDAIRAWETATVQRIVDGDTLIVKDEVTGAESRIRVIGINAPEIPTKSKAGWCGALPAKATLESLAPIGTRVRLASLDQRSTGTASRPQRVVLAWNELTQDFDLDLGWAMAERGWVVWFTDADEAAMSSLYREAIGGARARQVGIWDPSLCGPREQPDAQVSLRIGRAPVGGKAADEWVSVRNTGASAVDLSGWTLRDSGNSGFYTFPGGSILAPGDYRVVFSGKGVDGSKTGRDLYANRTARLYSNVGTGPLLIGDGAYLLDRAGAFRAWREYPCTSSCDADPLDGAVAIDAVSTGKQKGAARAKTQWVRLINRGATEACLDGYRLQTGGGTYRFPAGTCIPAGGTWTLNIASGKPSPGVAYWGRTLPALWISGSASLISDQERTISTGSW